MSFLIFGGYKSWTAIIFEGFNSIPFLLMMKPKNFLVGTLNAHFVGSTSNCTSVTVQRIFAVLLNDTHSCMIWWWHHPHIIQFSCGSCRENISHSSHVGGTDILAVKWHDSIIIDSSWCGECCFLYILLMHQDLVIPCEAIHKRQ